MPVSNSRMLLAAATAAIPPIAASCSDKASNAQEGRSNEPSSQGASD